MPSPVPGAGFLTSLFAAGLLFLWTGSSKPAQAQPCIYTLGLAITDGVAVEGLPPHLRNRHSQLVAELREKVQDLLSQSGRFRVINWDAALGENRYIYRGPGNIDFVLHVFLHRADKIFCNRVIYAYQVMGLPPAYGAREGGADYEIVSLPAISDRLEIRLIEARRDKVLWSAQRDSTAIVPHDAQTFILNTRKYPGLTPPGLLQEHLAELMRLRQGNSAVDRALDAADRWFVSRPAADVQVSQTLLGGLLQSFAEDLDSNLPLEGRIVGLLPNQSGEQQVQLDIGALDGLAPRLCLDVLRPGPATQKVGKLEVVAVDSTTSTARLKGLDRNIRKRGEGLQLRDRVISPKRPPKGRRNRP